LYYNYHANIKAQQHIPVLMLSYNTKETTLLKKCLASDNESISKTIYLCNEDDYVLYISRP